MSFREIGEHLEQYLLDLINEKRKKPFDRFLMGILFLASRVFRNIVQLRLLMYEKRFFRNRSLGCLVVSIGNLTCGGTGKTPVVEIFARTLSKKGRKVAILSRGYRSKDRTFWEKIGAMSDAVQEELRRDRSGYNDESSMVNRIINKLEVPPRVVSDGKELLLNSYSAGDEPYMLANNLKNVSVIVDKDRVKSGKYAISKLGVDTLILDDGFQYMNLQSHINIMLVDATNPFDNHHVLPRGLLREPIKNIRRADYIFLTKSNGSPSLRHLKDFIRKHNRRAEIIECRHKPLYLEDAYTKDLQYPLADLNGRKIASLSAIANPASFNAFLTENGAELVLKRHYADHHRYSEQEVIDFINDAKEAGAELILTTEKDAVRLPALPRRDLPMLFLRIQIDIMSGQEENFEKCIERICFI